MGKKSVRLICILITGILISLEIGMPVFAINSEKSDRIGEDRIVAFEETVDSAEEDTEIEAFTEIDSEASTEANDESITEDITESATEETSEIITDEIDESAEDELQLQAIVASGSCGADLTYTITGDIYDGYTLTISGSGPMTDYNYVNVAGGDQHTSAPWGDYIDNLVTLNIETGVTKIGKYAFYGCKNLKGTLTIPNTVTYIELYAFRDCRNFTGNLVIPEGVASVGTNAFEGCDGLKGTISLPSTLRTLHGSAFANLIYITGDLIIPEGIETISTYAFNNMQSLKGKAVIPASVKALSENALYNCSKLSSIENKSSFTITLPTPNKGAWYLDGDLTYTPITELSTGVAYRLDSIPEVVASGKCGDNLTYVIRELSTGGYSLQITGSGDMYNYKDPDVKDGCAPWMTYQTTISKLALSDDITSIGAEAFHGMNNLKGSLDLPDSLESIGFEAFYSCSGIREVILGSNLNSISGGAFSLMSNVTKIGTESNPRYVFANGILYEKKADESYKLLFCICARGKQVGEKVINATNDPLLKNVSELAEYSFDECDNLTSIDFTGADNLTKIVGFAINSCENMTSVILPENVVEVAGEAIRRIYNCEIWVYCNELTLSIDSISGSNCYYVTYLEAPSRGIAKKAGLNVEKVLNRTFRVNFYASDGVTLLFEENVEEGKNAVGPDKSMIPEIEGFIFVGWNKPLTNIKENTDFFPLYAKSKCKVIFDTQAAKYSPVYVKGGETITLPIPTAKGLVFKGWYPTEDGSGEPYTNNTIITNDVTLYAFWYYADVSVKDVKDSYEYLGTAIKPEVKVYDGSVLLTEKTDYVVTYKNNVNVYELGKDDAGFDASKAPTIIVTGKGNYSGTKISYFKISKHSLFSEDIVIQDIPTAIANGKENKSLPIVMMGKKRLVNNKDYILSYYSDMNCLKPTVPTNEGTYYVKIAGTGNYYRNKVIPFTIAASNKKLISKFSVKKIPDKQYTGEEVTLRAKDIVIMDGKKQLVPGQDYAVEYVGDNVSIGTAGILITGIGDTYVGSKEASFKIVGTDLKKASLTGFISTISFNGKARTQTTVSLVYNGEKLKGISSEEYADLTPAEQKTYSYIIDYTNNTNVGSAIMLLTGVNRFSGTVKKAFKISKFNIANDTADLFRISLDADSYEYVKNGVTPEVRVTFNGITLTKGKDYSVSYSNNKKLTSDSGKKGTVTVVGLGNYMGKDASTSFTIRRRNMEEGGIKVTAPDRIATGKKNTWKSSVTVTDQSGAKLVAGKDYDTNIIYTYENGRPVLASETVAAGTTIFIEVRGKGDYMGSASGKYRIYGKDISKLTCTVADKIYSGKPVTLGVGEVTFKSAGKEVTDVTYEIDTSSYKNNSKKGRASVTIRGSGEYGGSKVVTFNVTAMSIE